MKKSILMMIALAASTLQANSAQNNDVIHIINKTRMYTLTISGTRADHDTIQYVTNLTIKPNMHKSASAKAILPIRNGMTITAKSRFGKEEVTPMTIERLHADDIIYEVTVANHRVQVKTLTRAQAQQNNDYKKMDFVVKK